jgi:hypothetical protein
LLRLRNRYLRAARPGGAPASKFTWDWKICLATLSAPPGTDVLAWDRRKCTPGEQRRSGKLGCRVEWLAAAEWNATVTRRLGELPKVARERTRREHGRKARVEVLGYVCEAQQRGVFHPHVGLGTELLRTLRRLRRSAWHSGVDVGYGFETGRRGLVDAGMSTVSAASDAGRYISKYLRPDGVKSSFGPMLEAVNRITPRDPDTGCHKSLLRPVYVSPALTRLTGVTMGFFRFRRWVSRAGGEGVDIAELVAAYALHRTSGAVPLRV